MAAEAARRRALVAGAADDAGGHRREHLAALVIPHEHLGQAEAHAEAGATEQLTTDLASANADEATRARFSPRVEKMRRELGRDR